MPLAEKSWNLIYFLNLLSTLKVTWQFQQAFMALVNIFIILHSEQQLHAGGQLQRADTTLPRNRQAEQEGKVTAPGAKRILYPSRNRS